MSRWLFERVERLLDRCVDESASASARIEALEGTGFRIHVDGLDLDVLLRADGGRIRVLSGADAPSDVTVQGTPLDLLHVLGPDAASRLHGSGVTLTGRVHVAEAWADLLRVAMPDPEEELARWIGDIAAHRVGSAARDLGVWADRALDALRADTSEYLTEEGRLLPTRYESDALFAGIERLRDDVERAAARVDLLAARRANTSGRKAY